jgi:phage terminase large subunit
MINVNIPKSAFNKAYIPFINNASRTQIYFGGSSSGKSKFVIGQRVIVKLLEGGHNFLISRQTKNSIRGSVATEIAKTIIDWNLSDLFQVNKTDGTVTCSNGYQAAFAGLDDTEKLKSITFKKGVLTDVIVEEATETELSSIKQLRRRQRGKVEREIKKTITLLFNPILQSHWIYDEYFKSIGWTDTQKEYISDKLTILKTTYKDNDFLEPDDIEELESETDKYWHDVYTLGNWGVLGDVIFTNWVVADLSDPNDPYYLPEEQRTNRRAGGDFGFSKDPAAIGVSHYDKMRKRIYFYKELYETGLTNDVLAERTKELIGSDTITWDSAEPKSITELRNHGVVARGAKKGKDSVNFGIDWLKQQIIIVDKSCVNLQNELRQYHWKKDAGGNATKTPVDKNNHLIDGGLRYAYEGDMDRVDSAKLYAFK